nr:hypothetical protein [Tanacetum cinerariifolium]
MRYIDTKHNGEALKKCITEGPYEFSNVIIPAQPVTDNSPAVEEQTLLEDLSNISAENKAHYEAKKEAIHLLLTGIGDEIYSTVDACKIAHDMWIAIERLQHGESLNIQDIARNVNPLALVAVVQQYPDTYYQAPKPQRSYAPTTKQSSATRSNASTIHKGKELAKTITPPSESASEEDGDPKQAQKDKEIKKNLALIAKTMTGAEARKTVGIQETKEAKDYTYHKENMLLCKQAKKCVSLQAKQADWLEDTDEEVDEQELEAHYGFMAKIQEVLPVDSGFDAEPLSKVQYNADYNVFANERQHSEQSINDTYVVEKDDSNVIPDSLSMCDNDNQADQNTEECDDERAVLANLIANLTFDTEEKKGFKEIKESKCITDSRIERVQI